MKVALYVPSWPPGFIANGIVTYASQLVPALRRLGHEVFVLTPRKETNDIDPYTIDLQALASAPTLWDRAMFRVVPERASYKAASSIIASAIRSLVQRHQLDVLEIEESFGWSFAISLLRLMPVIVRLHGPWFLNGRFNDPDDGIASNRRREEREGRGIQRADFVTAPSLEVLQAVKRHYGLTLTASRVIPNPLEAVAETEIWNVKTSSHDSLLFVGRFDSRKGGDVVLRMFSELAACYPKLTLKFVGPDRGIKVAKGKIWCFDDFIRNSIPEECRSRIEFRGRMDHSDLMCLRRKCFTTVVASQYEIMPYSVLEAMSLGCPLVATAVGGIPELIKDGRNGLLLPSQDVGAMARACQRLLDDKGLAARIGRQAWRDCRSFYAPEKIAEQTVEAYQEAIDTFKRRKICRPTTQRQP
jgi:glycosyltransferase involved in cell wall biosynthesis